MADYIDCKYYEDCEYRNAVFICPNNCIQHKHVDEVRVVRCKDCKYSVRPANKCLVGKFVNCTLHDTMPMMSCNGYCSNGERRYL